MATKQEIQYKVHKIDGTVAAEGKVSLKAVKTGSRYLVHRAVVAQLNKKRQGTVSTKTRSEIAGGGKKPWKQKGTGNARSGSSNSPLWSGGGVAFGPKPRSYAPTTQRGAHGRVMRARWRNIHACALTDTSKETDNAERWNTPAHA